MTIDNYNTIVSIFKDGNPHSGIALQHDYPDFNIPVIQQRLLDIGWIDEVWDVTFLANQNLFDFLSSLPSDYENNPYGYYIEQKNSSMAITREMLDLELNKLRNEFNDHPKTNKRAIWAIIFAALSAVVALLSWLLPRK